MALLRCFGGTKLVLLLVLVSTLCYHPTPTFAAYSEGVYVDAECLKVPGSAFVGSVTSTIQTVREVISIVSKFSGAFGGDFRLSNAIADCLDLLDFSADELTWTLSTTQNPATGIYP